MSDPKPPNMQHQGGALRHLATSGRRGLTVLMAGRPGAMQSPGGGEIQMLALGRALPSVDVAARLWRPWEDALADADCLHLFGSLPEHLPLVEAAHRADRPVVLSTIAWFHWLDCWREPRRPWGRLAACARFMARSACPRLPSWRRRLYHAVDLLLPNSNAEAEQLLRYFQVPPERIHVVPNGADERFSEAEADADAFVRRVGADRFILYAGRIEPRKNQLRFLRAMRGAGVPIVVLGDVVPGHERYLAACRRAADRFVQFVPRLDHDDPMLAGAYAACSCLVLASWYETPGLAALEAAWSGTPLVLPRGGAASEYFGPLADYVDPGDLPGIRRAVLAALRRGRDPALGRLVRDNFAWNRAAAVTRQAYDKVTDP